MNSLKHRYTVTTKKIAFIFIFALLMLYPIFTVSAQSGTIVHAQASTIQPKVGDTLTVTITISNVQNLYGVDMELNWSTSVLQLISNSNTSLLGVESNPSGVLYAPSGDPIYYAVEDASQSTGTYELVGTSVAPATGFSGSGTIADIKFTVIGAGLANLGLQTQLANYNPAGASFIAHTDMADKVTAVGQGSSGTPTSTPTTTPTSTVTSSSSPSSSSSPTSTPEFSSLTILTLFIAMATTAMILTAKQLNKNKIRSVKSYSNNY